MTYRELLELYKKNELDSEQKTKIDNDIEKYEAISDYLYENAQIPDLELEQDNNEQDNDIVYSNREQEFTKEFKRAIRKAFLKMGTYVGVFLLIVIIFIQVALPHIVSLFYYDPSEEVANGTNRMSLDMEVYTELFMPGYIRNNVSVDDRGFGNYDICIYQNATMNQMFTNVSGRVEKGKLIQYNINALKKPSSNVFAWFQVNGSTSDSLTDLFTKGERNQSTVMSAATATESLKLLKDNTFYVAYVTLDKMMKYEDFRDFFSSNSDFYPDWCAVCTNEGDATGQRMFNVDNIGFACTFAGVTSINWDSKKYPNLAPWDVSEIEGDEGDGVENRMASEETMTAHFTDLLHYMSNQKQFLSMMEDNPYYFKNVADYVEKNGLTIYGFVTITDKETLLKLDKMDEVYQIATEPLK